MRTRGDARHGLFFFQAEDGIRDYKVTGVQTCALPICIIADHTREAGVRNLERELGRLLRKVATQIEAGKVVAPVNVGGEAVKTYLGRAKFHAEVAERTEVPGVATGLAVTGIGGEVLFVEAAAMDGQKGLTLTGQLGDVMKEPAQIGLSYVRSQDRKSV